MRPHARRWPLARARTPRGQHGLAGAAIVLGHGGAFLGVQLVGRALDSTHRKALSWASPSLRRQRWIHWSLQLYWSQPVLCLAPNSVIQKSNEY